MLKIISFKICPCYQRISALLEALSVNYKSEFLDLNEVPEWFIKISLDIEPVIKTEDGEFIAGLNKIIDYIRVQYYSYFDALDTRFMSDNEHWLNLANEQYINQCNAQRSSVLDIMFYKGKAFYEGLERIEKRIGYHKYFFGEKLSEVDIAWMPVLHRADIIKDRTGFDYLAEYPKLRIWQKNLMRTNIPEKSVPNDFDDVFDKFYLNKSTYIGRLYGSKILTEDTLSDSLCKCSL